MLTRKARSGRIYKGLQRCVASYTILRYSIMKYENKSEAKMNEVREFAKSL